MIKTLQRKFVITAMIAISVLMLLMLGAINIVNIVIVDREMDQTLAMISKNESGYGNKADNFEQTPPPLPFDRPKNDHDTLMSSTYFVVFLNQSGDVVASDLSRTTAVTADDAEELALQVNDGSSKVGKIGKYRYQIQDNLSDNSRIIVFLDASEEIFSYLRVLLVSILIGLICWFLMLVLVLVLAKKAIRPIAENIEKQRQFVTNAGHEIKTPLAIILSNTDAMELYNGASKWSKNIREQITRLNGLMKNLLMLARMDEGMVEQTISDFSLSEMLNESVDYFVPAIELKKIALSLDIQTDILLSGNQEQIAQVISILLDNAVKYTDEGGNIKVTLHKNQKRIKLQIANSCLKIPDAAPDKLFDRFYRDNQARTQKSGGYGIGLSVAESMVKNNKGHISAEYQNDNQVVFTIKF